MEKVYVHDNNKAVFICRKCGKSRTVDVDKYMKTKKPVYVNVKCSCGFHNKLLLERRNQYRKETALPGVFVCGKKKLKGPLVVKNLSLAGLGFELSDEVPFNVGEKVWVEFNLDDAVKSLIHREVLVRSIQGRQVGAEFDDLDPAEPIYKALKIYLY